MHSHAAFSDSIAGKLFSVTGANRGRDVFLGRGMGEPTNGRVLLARAKESKTDG